MGSLPRTPSRSPMHEENAEYGFTLIEILVVIIIIGILAAIAIPIFLNQQRAARDSATVSDMRNLALNMGTALAGDRDAKLVLISPSADTAPISTSPTVTASVTTYYVWTGTSMTDLEMALPVSKTEGTIIRAGNSTSSHAAGEFSLRAWNQDGLEYDSFETAIRYVSDTGGVTTEPM